MANDKLKDALQQVGMTPEQFAAIIPVDPKTVQRWLTGGTPYPRHRAAAARALEISEHELWPATAPDPEPEPEQQPAETADPQPAREPSPLGDVVASSGEYTHVGPPSLSDLVGGATSRIEIRHIGRLGPFGDGLVDLLADRARAGCQVRITSQWPTPELAALIGIDGIEVRIARAISDTCVLRCDDQILVLLPLATHTNPRAAAIHLRRQADGGLFDRYVEHLDTERTDTRTTDPITDPEEFALYLAATERGRDTNGATGPEQPATHTPTSDRDGPRRWPRRTG